MTGTNLSARKKSKEDNYLMSDIDKGLIGKYYTKHRYAFTDTNRIEFELPDDSTLFIDGQSWLSIYCFGDDGCESAKVLFAKENGDLLLFILPYGRELPTAMSIIDPRLLDKDSIKHFMRLCLINGSKRYTAKGVK
jgi:hypothetical protein